MKQIYFQKCTNEHKNIMRIYFSIKKLKFLYMKSIITVIFCVSFLNSFSQGYNYEYDAYGNRTERTYYIYL